MFCSSHTLAGIGVGDRQKQPDNAGREQNRIEHFILLETCGSMPVRRKPAIDASQCCTGEELAQATYKFEIDREGRLYKLHIGGRAARRP